MICHPCIPGNPEHTGTKSEMVASPLPSQGLKRGRKCYITPAFSWIPNIREQNLKWLPHPCLLRAQKRAEMLCHPCIPRDPQHTGTKYETSLTPAFSGAQKRAEMLHHPCILGASPTYGNKIRSSRLTPAFSRAQKRAEMLHHPCILGEPQHTGTKSKVAATPLPSRVPKRGHKCYIIHAFLGIPNIREQNLK